MGDFGGNDCDAAAILIGNQCSEEYLTVSGVYPIFTAYTTNIYIPLMQIALLWHFLRDT